MAVVIVGSVIVGSVVTRTCDYCYTVPLSASDTMSL